MNPLFEARDLHFAYALTNPVLCGASILLERGAMGALIGSNGCGKSTLIRMLAGILRPGRGEVRFEGTPLQEIPRRRLATKTAYVPQTHAHTFPFTALEVVLTGRSPYTPRFHFENELDRTKAREALSTVGIEHLANRRVTELSGGERQLVSVARALAQEPVCLLLDEPSASLDLKHRAGLARTLRDLRDRTGLTALMVTHDLALLDPVFDVVFAMRCGAIVAEGSPSEVLRDPVLAEIYDDANVRACRVEGRTFVWSDA